MAIHEKLLKSLQKVKKEYVDISKDSKKIAHENPSELLINARNLAGNQIQNQMRSLDNGRWIRAEYTNPAFDSMNFIYKNDIFSVIIDIQDADGKSYLPEIYAKRQLYASEQYNLIPCKFCVTVDNPTSPDLSTLKPKSDGWNLLHTKTNMEIIPENMATEEKTEMSKWELRRAGIMFVLQYLKTKNCVIKNFQDTLEVDPQIWFEDPYGRISWIILRCSTSEDEQEKPEKLNEIIRRCFKNDGYFVRLLLLSFNTDQKFYRNEKIKINVAEFEKVHSAM